MRSSPAPTTPDLVVLSLLAEKPRHGYEVNQELEWRDVRDWAEISRPQVYYSLAKLARNGMIHPVESEGGAQGPERQCYAISPAGRAALKKALKRPEWSEQRPPPPFLTWLALAAHAEPATVAEQLGRRRRYLQAELERERKTLAEFEGHAGGFPGDAAWLMVSLTVRSFETELAWLEEAQRRLARYTEASL